MQRKLVVFLGISVVRLAVPLFGHEKQPVEVTSTERMSFAPGGVIRVNDSYGSLMVEGWDRPEVAITVVKLIEADVEPKHRAQAAQRLEGVRIIAERNSDTDLAISTILPSRSSVFSPPLPPKTKGGVMVDYEIHVPRESRLVIHHGGGYVLVNGVTGDIEVTSPHGDIMLMLPGPGPYSIDARSKFGYVSSEFSGHSRNQYLLGQRFASPNPSPSRRIYLRMGFGGVTILQVPVSAGKIKR